MLVWRICKAIYAQKPFSGEGGLKAAARWHYKGNRIVYASQSLSLATLELWVHVDPEEPLWSYVAVSAEVPDDLTIQRFGLDVPSNWRQVPGPKELRDIGTNWLQSKSTVIARVPSVITPGEYNFLLNPEHPNFQRIKVHDPIPFIFDQRMWKAIG